MAFPAALLAVAIAFPHPGQRLPPVEACYVIGSVPRGVTNVTVCGREVAVYPTGAWSTLVPVASGTNEITAVAGTNETRFAIVVAPPPEKPASSDRPPEKVWEKLPYAADVPRAHPAGKAPGEITIVLDPGHGGATDLGALSPHGFPEKDANLQLALATRRALERRGFNVLMTREDDRAIVLAERPRIAVERGADAFVSLHHNAPGYATDPTDLRYEAVYSWNPIGERLAKAIDARLAAALDGEIPSKGALHANYAVTRNPEVPSCLVEADFITSPAGEESVWCAARRLFLAEAIADGIADWSRE